MSTNKKFTVITVNYNSTEKLNRLLDTLDLLNNYISDIIVVDNNSSDISALNTVDKRLKTILNKNNLGFAKAVNQGIRLAKSNIILLINPDCEIIDKTPIKSFQKILVNKNIGAIGGKIINTITLKSQYTATNKPNFMTALFEFTNLKKVFPNNPFSGNFWVEKDKKMSSPTKVYSLCGAYMFFRKQNGIRFNEDYFLYMEDLEFGNTIIRHHMETWFDPESQIKHISGFSSRSKYNIVLKHWYKSRKIYFLNNLNTVLGYTLFIIFSLEEAILFLYHHIKNTPNE